MHPCKDQKHMLARKQCSLYWVNYCIFKSAFFLQGFLFIRILDLFRTNCHAKRMRFNDGFQWFLKFLPKFNGLTYTQVPLNHPLLIVEFTN